MVWHAFFLTTGIRLSVWGTSIGGTRLTNINFSSLGTQVKFIDTMKIFLTSLLGQLARTLEEVGKARVEKLTL